MASSSSLSSRRTNIRPRLQIAVDNPDLVSALLALNRAEPTVDVIECGTILIIAEGLRAVREIRALYPGKTILADIRIAEAGSLVSRHCFETGATWVSCVSDVSLATIGQVIRIAAEFDGEVQVELGESYDAERAGAWRELGVGHVIMKRSRNRKTAGDLSWGPDDLARISELAGLGLMVTIAGGTKAAEPDALAGAPVRMAIAGRNIMGTWDLLVAA